MKIGSAENKGSSLDGECIHWSLNGLACVVGGDHTVSARIKAEELRIRDENGEETLSNKFFAAKRREWRLRYQNLTCEDEQFRQLRGIIITCSIPSNMNNPLRKPFTSLPC